MGQVQKGNVSLDDTSDEWVDLPYAKRVTVRMLLSQRSGIPDYTMDPWFGTRYFGIPSKRWSPNDLVSMIEDKPLDFEPDSRYEYSNSNYLLLGVILEKATGEPYEALLREGVTEKLGWRDTFFETNYPEKLAIADDYVEAVLPFGTKNLTGFRTSLETGAYSAGGVLSDSKDVARFTHALFTGRILSEPTLVRMEAFDEAPEDHYPEQTGYGLGMRKMTIDGEQLVGHTGTIGSYSGISFLHNQEKGYTMVVLSNLSTVEQTRLVGALQEVVP